MTLINSSPNFTALRNDFPMMRETNRGKPLIYLDSAASAQKPKQVMDAIAQFYSRDYANIHRGIYELSERATTLYENARQSVQQFIHAAHAEEIVFVRSTTEGINLVANSLGRAQWQAGDEVILSEMEHHSNIVPWYLLKEQLGIVLKIIPITDDGALDMKAYQPLFSPRTKLVAIAHASNVLGTINPIKNMTAIAHAHHVPVLVDGAQAVPHMPVDVQDLDCDFYVFSAHKLYGPTGIGVLYGKKELLDAMPPYQGGGDMIETVAFEKVTFAKVPHKFEAGTPHIAGAIGLAEAIRYLQAIGAKNSDQPLAQRGLSFSGAYIPVLDASYRPGRDVPQMISPAEQEADQNCMQYVYAHEQALLAYALPKLQAIQGLRIIGTATPKVGVISFVLDTIHPHDIGTVLDHEGIAVRAGHHCAMPLMARLQVPATVRASFGIYNNEQDVDALIDAIHLAKRLFG